MSNKQTNTSKIVGTITSYILIYVCRRNLAACQNPVSLDDLMVLILLRDTGFLCGREIRLQTNSSAATVSERMTKLVDLGYVETKANEFDGRAVNYSLTEKGSAYIEERMTRSQLADEIDRLDQQDQADFLRILGKMRLGYHQEAIWGDLTPRKK